mmetsp:Transcript_12376/g.27772  ORF Transcript_12376/g.27772 Transcript_12376/m.27772 type:complete len:212 (+) Transcript_12376:799-1434(+)
MAPCEPSNAHQWFQIGRCTAGYSLDLKDGACPAFRKVSANANSTGGDTLGKSGESIGESGNEVVFCSLTLPSLGPDKCVDIAGESPTFGSPLLAYECTGRWNQLFRLGDNCTIIAEQPGFVGRVRGFGDKDILNCLDSSHSGKVLSTAACAHKPIASKSSQSGNSTVGYTSAQQFEFMPAEGNAFRKYITVISKPDRVSVDPTPGTADRKI